MNFSEFKKRIGAEPWSRDPEVLEARESDPRCERAAREAEAFERRFERALGAGAPGDLAGRLRAIPDYRPGPRLRWFAAAASLAVVAGAAAVYWYQASRPMGMDEYLELHYGLDGVEVLASATPDFNPSEVNRLMATLDALVDPELVGKVRFIKYCPTLDGQGAHMVVSSGRGMLTVFYMPHTEIAEERLIQFNGRQARLLALSRGSAAVFGATDQSLDDVSALVRNAIRPLPEGA